MNFKHDPIDLGYDDLTTEPHNGKRFYVTPEGKRYPSVTTVLGVRNRESIQKWRARVGEEEANRISSFAASRGTRVHTMVERYLDNRDDYLEKSNQLTRLNFSTMQPVLDERIGTVVAQEVPLYSNHLGLAGRVDCIAEFDGRLSIIDFKTSRKEKKEEWITNYFIQASFYAAAFYERTGIAIKQGGIIITVDGSEPQGFKVNTFDYLQHFVAVREKYRELQGI